MNLVEHLGAPVAARPDAAAIIDTRRGRSRALSFAELELASQRAATLFQQTGLEAGDVALIFQPMSAELYIALLGLLRLGVVAMFLDPSAGREHLERCCELQPPRALLAGARAHWLRLVSPALRRIPKKFSIGLRVPGAVPLERAQRLAPTTPIHACKPDAPALLTFTSGSTGQPKAALRTHGFLLAQHRVLEKNLCLAPGEVDLTTLPIFLLANLASGVTSVIPNADLRAPGAIDPSPVAGQIRQHRSTRTAASPAFLERLIACPGEPLAGFQKIYTGGAPVFPRLLEQLQRAAPQAEVVAVYGSTEAEPIAHVERRAITPEDFAAMLAGRGLLAGPPAAEIQLRILRDQWGRPVGPFTASEFAAACVVAGEPGEIVVSGEHVLTTYLHGHGDEEAKFAVEGRRWHRTGDAGYLDAQGRLWLLGRCSARIQDGGGTLYPFTVECAAHHHPGVRRAAVVEHNGRRVLAIEGEQGADCSGLESALAWAHIDTIRVLNKIPVDKRHNAKVDYPALRKMLE